LRILIYSAAEKADGGGVQGVVQGLAEYLRQHGHRTVVAWPDGEDTHENWRLRLEAAVGRGGKPGPRALARALRDLSVLTVRLLRFRPDVVNLHFPRGQSIYFQLLKRLFRFRLIYSFHGSDYHEASAALRARLPGWLESADGITSVSRPLADNVRRLAGRAPITLIENGVDSDFWGRPAEITREPGLVVAAGRLLPVKGFDVLIQALTFPETDEVRLIIAGEGPEERNLKRQVVDLKLQDRADFAGRLDREALRTLFGRAALFVLPSRREGMPLIVLEAMAAGVPIIATNVGGVPDALGTKTGNIVRAEDPEALAKAIGERIGNAARCRNEATPAVARARTFDRQKSFRSYEALFESALER